MPNIAQTSLSSITALAVTFGLFAIMNSLIANNDLVIPDEPAFKVPDIQWKQKTIEPITTQPPEQIDTTPPPPTVILSTETTIPDNGAITIEQVIYTPPGTTITGPGVMDGNPLPLVKVAAVYPSKGITRGIEGHCTVMYTITATGSVSNVQVVENDCSHGIFHKNSIKAAQKFKYNPRVVNGQAIETHGVRNRFTFQLEK